MNLQVVSVSGPPRDRGRTAGRELADSIHRSLAFYRDVLRRRGISPDSLPGLLAEHHKRASSAHPEVMEELVGLSEGAEAPFWEIFAVNAWEELEPILETRISRCTSFAVATPAGTLLGHNEQWYAGDVGNIALLLARTDEDIRFAAPIVVTCLPVVGMNSLGLAFGVMSLTARDDRIGVPRRLTARAVLEARSLREAEQRATEPGRAGGYAYIVAAARGRVCTIETSADRHVVQRGDAAHTNHYLAQGLTDVAPSPHPGSISRLRRLTALLSEQAVSSPEDAMAILRDHGSQPQAICRHPDGGDETTAVLFSMVCHLEERRIWLAAGHPCSAAYEEVDLHALMAAAPS